jgi:hypothetical protein
LHHQLALPLAVIPSAAEGAPPYHRRAGERLTPSCAEIPRSARNDAAAERGERGLTPRCAPLRFLIGAA